MTREEHVKSAVNRIKALPYVTEINAKRGSFEPDGSFRNWVGLMVETEPHADVSKLLDLIDEIESENRDFDLVISLEPDMVDRSHGTILWKRG